MELLAKLGINWGLLIAQIVNFAILLAILTKFLYRPLLRLLDERSARVRKAMDDAARVEQETRDAELFRQKRLRQVDEEAGVLLGEAKERAAAIEREAVEIAQKEAAIVLERGRHQLEEERRAALADLQASLATAVVRVSQAVLEREFDDNDQKRILESAAKQIPSMLA